VALGLSPMQLTFLGLATNVVIGWLLVQGYALLPGLLSHPAGLFDSSDGAVARLRRDRQPVRRVHRRRVSTVSRTWILFSCLFWMLSGQGQSSRRGSRSRRS